MVQAVPDPLEAMNRMIWSFNRTVLVGFVKPSAYVYRAVIRKPFRTGIANFGRNVSYPGRLINNLLQQRWAGALTETDRFLCNSILGVGGFIDVASYLKMPKSEADFGQTLGQWGWEPQCFLMLPIYGPSSERDTVGLATDTAANPLTYFTPYPFDPGNPLTYFSPYTYASYGITYNNLTDSVDDYVRMIKTEKDPYSLLRYAWSFSRERPKTNEKTLGPPDEASLETLQSVMFAVKDPKFPGRGRTRSVVVPSTGRKLKFTFWLQPGRAPLVYILPGLGSHRLSGTVVALAELVYRNGFSPVCVSSAYNYEFMERASTVAMPAYTPLDAHDVHVACTEVDRRLQKSYPDRLAGRALLGYSMGGFHALFLAATAATNETSLLSFQRYVAIDAPVRLLHGISQLDEYYRAPLAWDAEDRAANLDNTFRKVAALAQRSAPAVQGPPPFSGVESKFLVGAAFRLILRDIIFSSQERTNMGILKNPVDPLRREPVYQEILRYSFGDYLQKFLVPYYQTRGIDLTDPAALARASDLRTYQDGLRSNSQVRLIVNRNDILLAPEDLAWLEDNFDASELTVFEKGGHLGNLPHPTVQSAIVRALDGLKENSR
jgi:ABC-type transporter lipoprotein component MlaA/pimeloyl-ACP methyl ester carboxylesterase